MAKRAVILEPGDRKKRAMIDMLHTIRAEKSLKRNEKQSQRKDALLKKKETERMKFEPKVREEKKRKYAEKGKEEMRRKKLRA